MGESRAVRQIRRFNRFYTNLIGVLHRSIHDTAYSLTEARLLFEIAHRPDVHAREIKETLQVDEGYLSRTIDKLARQGLIARKKWPEDRRAVRLRLSPMGRRALETIDARADAAVQGMIRHLPRKEVNELLEHMKRIRELLEGRSGSPEE